MFFYRFEVEKKTGTIRVAECDQPGAPHCLDFETRQVYFLSFKVYSSLVTFTIKFINSIELFRLGLFQVMWFFFCLFQCLV